MPPARTARHKERRMPGTGAKSAALHYVRTRHYDITIIIETTKPRQPDREREPPPAVVFLPLIYGLIKYHACDIVVVVVVVDSKLKFPVIRCAPPKKPESIISGNVRTAVVRVVKIWTWETAHKSYTYSARSTCNMCNRQTFIRINK